MADRWEQLKGNTYPDTEAEQLAALETDETVHDYKRRREAWSSDPYRPIYHLSSLYGMGDANGLCEWQGRYHLFYQSYGRKHPCFSWVMNAALVGRAKP